MRRLRILYRVKDSMNFKADKYSEYKTFTSVFALSSVYTTASLHHGAIQICYSTLSTKIYKYDLNLNLCIDLDLSNLVPAH